MDAKLKDAMEYHAKPLYIDGRRVFGPFTSSTLWEAQEHMHPDHTVVHCWLYHDETEFQLHSTALPIMGKNVVYCMFAVYVLSFNVLLQLHWETSMREKDLETVLGDWDACCQQPLEV
jgi:hypothetical protein